MRPELWKDWMRASSAAAAALGLLTDLEGYDAWERAALALLARDDLTAGGALAILEPCDARRAILAARSRQPACKRSSESSRLRPSQNRTRIWTRQTRRRARVRLALSSVPSGCVPSRSRTGSRRGTAAQPAGDDVDETVRGYLAARLFGNWIAYSGQGLHAIVEYLHVALAVMKMEAVRHHAQESASSPWQTVKEAVRSADLLLVHLADPRTLARLLDAKPPA